MPRERVVVTSTCGATDVQSVGESSPRLWKEWSRLVGAAALCIVVWLGLACLLWWYVPMHAAAFAEIGAPLPWATLVTLTASNWFVRLLPFAVITCVLAAPLAAGIAGVLLAMLVSWRRLRTWLALGADVMSILGLVACGFVIVSVQIGY
jgi:hypothetical protein